jgi:hypothetical protein
MKIIVIVLLVGVCFLAVRFFSTRLKAGDTDGGFVTTRDFAALYSALRSTGSNGSFWVVLIPGTARDDGYTANLQYSIEDGVAGLDWVLLAKRNSEDKEKFVAEARKAGAKVGEKEMNDVRYLRVTDAKDLVGLGQEVLVQLYGVKPTDRLQLIITDFQWLKSDLRNQK